MSTPWPDDLVAKIGLPQIISIRKMSRTSASDFVREAWPDLDATELEMVLSVAIPDDTREQPNTAPTPYQKALEASRYRGIFLAAAWEANASWTTLARMFEVSRQTISVAAGKYLNPDTVTRNVQRLGHGLKDPSMSTVAAWFNWYELNIVATGRPMPTVKQLATTFLTIVDE